MSIVTKRVVLGFPTTAQGEICLRSVLAPFRGVHFHGTLDFVGTVRDDSDRYSCFLFNFGLPFEGVGQRTRRAFSNGFDDFLNGGFGGMNPVPAGALENGRQVALLAAFDLLNEN